MSNAFNNIVIYNGYPLSIVAALGIHVAVLLSMLYLQIENKTQVLDVVPATVIKSLFIDENPQVTNERNIERQRLERIEQQRLARQREEQQQRDAAAAEQAREREEALAQRREQERQQAALVERQELERQRAEEQLREKERDAARERDLAEARQQEQIDRQRAEDRIREQEEANAAASAAASAARTEFELVQSATGLIQQLVQGNWSRPPSARNGMRVVLRISMFPTGEVTDVTIVQSSNDAAFDRAAENAVYRAAPFRELSGLPIKIFNENFRSLSLTFQPEDLLN